MVVGMCGTAARDLTGAEGGVGVGEKRYEELRRLWGCCGRRGVSVTLVWRISHVWRFRVVVLERWHQGVGAVYDYAATFGPTFRGVCVIVTSPLMPQNLVGRSQSTQQQKTSSGAIAKNSCPSFQHKRHKENLSHSPLQQLRQLLIKRRKRGRAARHARPRLLPAPDQQPHPASGFAWSSVALLRR